MRPDPSARLLPGRDGALLLGGQPLRVLRLNPSAAAVVRRWMASPDPAGSPVALSEQVLATRLHHAGLVARRPDRALHTHADVTVVVPVRDRAPELAACLASVGPCAAVLVVDDASDAPAAVAAVAAAAGARLVRRELNGGPAAARTTGLDLVDTELVALVDSDVRLPPEWLDGLLPVLADPEVAVVAPRVVGAGGHGALAAYERRCSPLDLGAVAGPVRPGARVGHVPAAVLLARTRDLHGSGFDADLRVAEDVDLVWRLDAAGRSVRYEPSVVVAHGARSSVRAWLSQRHGYGRGAALLDERHPGQVAPAVVGKWSVPMLAALATGHPAAAVGWTAVCAGLMAARLPAVSEPGWRDPVRVVAATRLVVTGQAWTVVGVAEAAARVWLPVLAPAALMVPALRRPVAGAVAVRLVRSWRATGGSGLDPVRWAGLKLADDLAYGTGVWREALRRRRPRVLLPRLV